MLLTIRVRNLRSILRVKTGDL